MNQQISCINFVEQSESVIESLKTGIYKAMETNTKNIKANHQKLQAQIGDKKTGNLNPVQVMGINSVLMKKASISSQNQDMFSSIHQSDKKEVKSRISVSGLSDIETALIKKNDR